MSDRTQTWLQRSQHGWKWQFRADWAPFFDSKDCPDWLDLGADPRAALVKTNEGREIWRVEAGPHLLFVKVSRPPRRWARARRTLLGPDALREWRVADYAARHGISTISPVAFASKQVEGRTPDSIFISKGLRQAHPLSNLWLNLDPADRRTRAIKNRVIDAVARLLAHAHQNGFVHSDLHAGNVLIEPAADGDYLAIFVDLHGARIGRRVSDRAVTRNLAQFGQWFRVRGLLTDRVRFLDRYLDWRDAVHADSAHPHRLTTGRRELVHAIDRAAAHHAQTLYAKRDHRVMRTGRYFARLELRDGWQGHVFLEAKHPAAGSPTSTMTFTPQQWRQWLTDPLTWVNGSDRRRIIKDSGKARICRAELPLPDGAGLEVVCKRDIAGQLLRRIQSSVRTSRAMLTWKRGHALLNRRIPTARPLAALERRRFGLLLDSLLITECVQHAHDLDTVLTVQMREMPPERQRWLKRYITESLVTALRRLHECGLTHRDLKAPNVIVQWDPHSSQEPRVTLVDLDGIRRSWSAGRRAELRALARLNVSLDHCRRVTRTDRLRFLKRYFDRPGRPALGWKSIWRDIATHSDRKRRQQARQRNKMLAKFGRF